MAPGGSSSWKKKAIVGSALVAAGAYAGYKVYNAGFWEKTKERLAEIDRACNSLTQAAKGSSDVVSLVSTELEAFLQSDSDEVPRSIRQLLKIAASKEFQQATASLSGSLVRGVNDATQGPCSRKVSVFYTRDADWNGIDFDSVLHTKTATSFVSSRCACDGLQEPGFVDKVMDKLFTKPGQGFASAIVGSVVRELTSAYLDSSKVRREGDEASAEPSVLETVFDKACTDQGRRLVTDCVTTLVVNAVTVFLDKTAGVNVYDDLWASMSKPGHTQQVRDLVGTLANSAVDTLVRTSHEVLTAEKPSRPPASARREHGVGSPTSIVLEPRVLWPEESRGDAEQPGVCEDVSALQRRGGRVEGLRDGFEDEGVRHERARFPQRSTVMLEKGRVGSPAMGENAAWLQEMFSTLVDPQNRRFLMDVTGVAAYEAVRALVAGLHDVLWRTPASRGRRGVGGTTTVVSYSRMLDDYFRAVAAKALVCVTVCLAICLNVVSRVVHV